MSFAIKRQRDAMDCGPSCLAMIAKHYGQQAIASRCRFFGKLIIKMKNFYYLYSFF